MKVVTWLAVLVGILILTYILGPKTNFPKYNAILPKLNYSFDELKNYVAKKDSNVPNLKFDNESRLIWSDHTKKTPYSLVYLHGFSASPMEGNPVHVDFASRYGMNCYIPRLTEHGIGDKNAMENLTPKALIDDAKEALAIGQLIGEKVILMSCSTGSTLSIYLAANHPDKIHSMIMYSPNIRISDDNAKFLGRQWGLQIGRKLIGNTRKLTDLVDTPFEQYTTVEYKVEGVIALQHLLQETMIEENFRKVKMPFMAGYYYKDEENKDVVISIDGIKEFANATTTNEDEKRLVAWPDVQTHVIPSSLYCKDMDSVFEETYKFAEEVLGLGEKNEDRVFIDTIFHESPEYILDISGENMNKIDREKLFNFQNKKGNE